MHNTYKASRCQGTVFPLTPLHNAESLTAPARVRRFSRPACAFQRYGDEPPGWSAHKHISRVCRRGRPRIESVPDCRPTQRRCSDMEKPTGTVISRDQRGADTEYRLTSHAQGKAGLRCRANHVDSRSLSFDELQLCGFAPASQPDCVYRLSKNRRLSNGSFRFRIEYTARPSLWASR
jgi:hypothetical protein